MLEFVLLSYCCHYATYWLTCLRYNWLLRVNALESQDLSILLIAFLRSIELTPNLDMIHTDENFCSSQTLGEEHEKSNQNLQSIRKFTDTLNLSQKQMLDLNNISNIFFYLKVRTRNKSYTFSRGASSNNFEIQRNVSGAFMKSKLMKASTNLHMSRSKSLPASIAVKSSMKRTLRLDPLPGSRNSTRQSACKPTSPSVLEGTPYDLEVVEHGAIDPTNYTTLSAQGVTLFKDKESYFTPLAQWEREFELFQKISLLKFFRQYSRWKVGYCKQAVVSVSTLLFISCTKIMNRWPQAHKINLLVFHRMAQRSEATQDV